MNTHPLTPTGTAPLAAASKSTSPAQQSPSARAWQRFRRNRLGFGSLIVFLTLFVLSLGAEFLSNDKPLVVRFDGQWYFPVVQTLPEKVFGGDFETPADYLDPFIQGQLHKNGNWALQAPNPYHHSTLDYFAPLPNPAGPTARNWLGTDDRGRDVLARLVYGFRVSVLFALALTLFGVLLGVLTGAVQGFFVGKTDLVFQRFIEIWSAMPELYLLIIFSAVFEPSVGLLLLLLSLLAGWVCPTMCGLSSCATASSITSNRHGRWGWGIGKSCGGTCCPTA